ncbi:MAG: hypothetical protein R3C20_03980 [Planctomycetaceae bacterium]
MKMTTLSAFYVCSLLSSSVCLAGKGTDISPDLAKPGQLLFEDQFDDAQLGTTFVAVKGEWKVVDGVVVGNELATDKHAAVLNCQKKNRNSIVRFSFRLDGSTDGLHLSLNHAKGHLFRVIIAENGMTVRTDADKKDKSIKSELIGQAKGAFEKGKWYTLQVEMKGNQVVAATDNGLKVSGENVRLDTDKPNYRFVMKGESLSIDDLKIWSAE